MTQTTRPALPRQASALPATPSPARPARRSDRPNTINLTRTELDALIAEMDDLGARVSAVNRLYTRVPYRGLGIPVTFAQAGNPPVTLKLAGRNIGRGGIGLLHNVFTFTGTAVVVSLPRLDGTVRHVPGVVTRCQHRGGIIHELGVRFDELIDLREHLPIAAAAGLRIFERVMPDLFEGTVLIAEHDESAVRVLTHYMRDTSVRVEVAAEVDAAVELVARHSPAVVLAAQDLPGSGGAAGLTRQLRAAGSATPIIVSSDGESELHAKDLAAMGACSWIRKPYRKEELVRALAEFLIDDRKLITSHPTPRERQSDAEDDSARELPSLGEELLTTLDHAASLDTYAVCLQIIDIAEPAGFLRLRDEAQFVCKAIEDGRTVVDAAHEVRRLAERCIDAV